MTALLCLALTGACSTAAEPAAPRTPAPVAAAWPGCEEVGAFADPRGGGAGPPHVGGVPAGFTAVRAVLCEEGERADAQGNRIAVDLERTSTNLAPLLTYLARPDGRPTQAACPAVGFVPPWLFLVDADGRYVAPAIPRDGCGLPLEDSANWHAGPWTDTVLRERGVTESADAERSGCGPAYKDPVPELDDATDVRGRPLGATGFGSAPLRICVWTVDPGQEHDSVVGGTFRSGRTLEGAEQQALDAALAAAPAGPTRCRQRASTFATVEPADAPTGTVWVELDGCRRVYRDVTPRTVAQADDGLMGLLTH